ncbi:MAG TPA: DUF1028 domain-containing protein [Solirubrobacteraceae bacterium]|nr:DUF1028 domain-containing protein [Solirubrobacteraceae bacterium]
MTFSLLGRCERSGRLGMVVSSSSPAVAARCVHVRPRIGIAASQNVTDPRLGPLLLDELAAGRDARGAIDAVVAGTPQVEHRQLIVLAGDGDGASYTGAAALGLHGDRRGPGCAAAGNLLADESVLDAMTETFAVNHELELGDRLVAALRAAAQAGGEAGPVHSAGLVMTGDVAWPVADLRVDWHDDPIEELAAVWDVYRPQLDDYVARALDPTAAPAFGVPGDE